MSPENMGKVSKRLRIAFAASSVLFLGVLAVSPVKDLLQEWKKYRREYVHFAETRPDTKRLLADFHPGIDQIWIPEMNVTDRCTTCHQGITQASLLDASVPQPFRAHTPMPHQVEKWGCVVCHQGQGLATEVREAHETTLAWEQPLLPVRYIQASCGVCHRAAVPETPQLNLGREVLVKLNCVGCHRLEGVTRPASAGAGFDPCRNQSQPSVDLQVAERATHHHGQQRQHYRGRRGERTRAAHAPVPAQ